MNRYDLGWRQHLAFRWACRSTRHADLRDCAVTLALLLAILFAYGIVGAMDYTAALRTEAEAHAARAERMSATVADCMNGRAVFTYPNDSGKGFGKTAVVCRPAEEFAL